MTTGQMDDRVHMLKRKLLLAVQDELSARDFEVPGSGTDVISALAELLIFFSIGDGDYRRALPEAEHAWWSGFCDALKAAGTPG